MTSPIDIVYTWVDNNDSFWQEKKARAKESSFDEKYANVNGRFRDNGELKYSLRSVAKYFPDVNKIYIVTDNQVPNFLRKHEKIVIVDHTDIILKEFLPTFSSKNIESHLVNIS